MHEHYMVCLSMEAVCLKCHQQYRQIQHMKEFSEPVHYNLIMTPMGPSYRVDPRFEEMEPIDDIWLVTCGCEEPLRIENPLGVFFEGVVYLNLIPHRGLEVNLKDFKGGSW